MKKQIKLAGAMLAIVMSATSIVNAQWTRVSTAPTYIKLQYIDDRVGIGLIAPNSKLHVYSTGTASLTGAGIFTIGAISNQNLVFDNDEIQSRNNGGASLLSMNYYGGNVWIGKDATATSATPLIHGNAAYGNVGIGTTAVNDHRLFVSGSATSSGAVIKAKANYIHPSGTFGEVRAIEGVATSDGSGVGVYGVGDWIGVRGLGYRPNAGAGNVVIGVYGEVSGSSASQNWAGYFVGKTYVDKLCIGTTDNTYALNVCGTIRAKEVRVETGWCDYVFADDYKLPALSEVESFIKENKHLPGVTAGPEIETNGLEVGKVSAQMIKKIEELMLYVIQLDKQNKELKNEIDSLKK